MFEIHCECCGLFLGEAEQAVKIVCPFCLRLRAYVRIIALGEFDPFEEWGDQVFQTQKQTNDIMDAIGEKRRIDGAI